MSENSNTSQEENLNEEIKKTIRVQIKEIDAEDILRQLGAPVPPAGEIDEIHLVIQH